MDGNALVKALLDLTGLPQESLSSEMDQMIHKSGLNKENVSLDDLRLVLEEYLHSVFPEVQREYK